MEGYRAAWNLVAEKSRWQTSHKNPPTYFSCTGHAKLRVARAGCCAVSDSPASYLGRRKICREPEIAVIIPWRMLQQKKIKKLKLLHSEKAVLFNHMRMMFQPSRTSLFKKKKKEIYIYICLEIPNASRRHHHNFR